MRSLNKNLRLMMSVLAIVFLFFTLGFAASSENIQTKSGKKQTSASTNKKPTPTPKKAEKISSKTTAAKSATDKKSADKKTAKPTSTSSNKSPKSPQSKSTAKSTSKPATKTTKTPAKSSTKTTNAATQAKTKKPSESPSKISSAKTSKPAPVKTPAQTEQREPSQAIVSVAAARVRAEPSTNATEIRRIKLGTLVKVVEENPTWYKVEFSSSPKSGWMSKQVANDFDENRRTEIYRQIVDRNYKEDKMTFADAAELYEFLTRAQTDFKESNLASEIGFKRLLALRSALKAVPFGKGDEKPYSEFLKANDKTVVYSEPSAEWYIRSELLWDLQKKYAKETIAEEIAWTAAQNPLPGECEGYINCYLFVLRETDGEYLDRYPNGKYAEQSLKNIQNLIAPIEEDLKEKKVYNGPSDVSDRAEFNKLIAELRTIVSKLPFAEIEKQKTIQQLNKIAEGYR